MVNNHTFIKPEPAPEGTTLEQIFNGREKVSMAHLKIKLGKEAVTAAFAARRLLSCGHGQVRLTEATK